MSTRASRHRSAKLKTFGPKGAAARRFDPRARSMAPGLERRLWSRLRVAVTRLVLAQEREPWRTGAHWADEWSRPWGAPITRCGLSWGDAIADDRGNVLVTWTEHVTCAVCLLSLWRR